MEKNFKTISKIAVAILVLIGVIGLLRLLLGNLEFGTGIEMTHDFGRLNSARIFLMAWETFWLTSIVIFFIYVATKARGKKSHEQVEQLEDIEPLVFKIIIGGLILAALLTLLLPAFVGPGLPQYNTHDEGTAVSVEAQRFNFIIEGTSCIGSDAPSASCATFQTGVKYIFELQSRDTTHGFTIYDSNNVLLVQAQIVPGYLTRLAFTFTTTGDYAIRCAEYCGAGHHIMMASFTVTGGA